MKTFMGNNHKPGFLKIFFVGFLVYLLGGFPTLAFALPQGGDIVSGSATIDSTSQDMTINQSTNKLITNWDSFNIDTPESVQFIQPGSGSVALNRVSGINRRGRRSPGQTELSPRELRLCSASTAPTTRLDGPRWTRRRRAAACLCR